MSPLYQIHEKAEVGPGCFLSDAKVWQFATVEGGVMFGLGVVVGSCAWIGRGSRIGHNTRIQHGAFICRDASIGENVFIGPNVVLADDKHPVVNNPKYKAEPPYIQDNVSIGAGAVILPGVTVGEGAKIGAGAVVVYNVPPHALVVGVPGKAQLTDAYHD